MTALDSLRVYQVTALYGVTVAEVNSAIENGNNRIHTVKPRTLRNVA